MAENDRPRSAVSRRGFLGLAAAGAGVAAVGLPALPSRASVPKGGPDRTTLRWPRASYALRDFTVESPDQVHPELDGDTVVVPLSPGTTRLTTGR